MLRPLTKAPDDGAVSAVAVATASGSSDASGGKYEDMDFAAMDTLDAPELAFCGAWLSVFPNGTLLLDGGTVRIPPFPTCPDCLPIVYLYTRCDGPCSPTARCCWMVGPSPPLPIQIILTACS